MLLTTAPVMFFGGKGGVGKTTVSAATAVRLAESGARVLLVSTDPAHNLGHIWSVKLSDTPSPLEPGLDVMELNPAATTERHLRQVGDSMRAMMPERMHREVDKHLELSRNSPGMHEAAMLERIAEIVGAGVADGGYDHIIFDTAPSGHTSRLLALPELMAAYTDGLLERREKSDNFSRLARGMGGGVVEGKDDPVERRNQQIRSVLYQRRRKFEVLRGVLTDPSECVFHIVLTPERLPVMESAELYRDISASGIRVAGLVVNRRSPDDGGEFTAARREVERGAVALLDELLPGVERVELPWLPREIGTREALSEIAALL
ncbi:ArsA family ATPase [Corynebacterium sp. CNCTC7651]|uniref:ArsA family ATPase n=1 Tax=Corynebacterium sp. CNCTC7651 TaxID=2815361 RepID=UPI001F356D9D|nr:ArsA family ATPase [Corynebacterium sp. CNCTC7651]